MAYYRNFTAHVFFAETLKWISSLFGGYTDASETSLSSDTWSNLRRRQTKEDAILLSGESDSDNGMESALSFPLKFEFAARNI